MVEACLSLGSNLGCRRAVLAEALTAIDELPDTSLSAVSSLYETEPWGDEDQPDFLNLVTVVQTGLTADQLLRELQSIEDQLGRERDPARRWGPRAIDIDVLLFGDERREGSELIIPHPRLHERAFVLVPLHELRPELTVSDRGQVADLIRSTGAEGVEKITGPDWYQHFLGKK